MFNSVKDFKDYIKQTLKSTKATTAPSQACIYRVHQGKFQPVADTHQGGPGGNGTVIWKNGIANNPQPELYDFEKYTPTIYFSIESKIREVKDTSITKTGIKIKTKYEFSNSKEYKEKDFKTVLEWAKYIVQKIKDLKQQEKINKMQVDF